MDKLKLHTKDFTEDNIEKLAGLFPNCVVEAQDEETGELRRTIDFDQLRQELSKNIVEGPQERYRLDWPGKREALLTANAAIAKTLRPCREESVDFDKTQNLYIEGDNLDALKLLQETYLGKVKMIYIDPPYNTGKDFIYVDDFTENSEQFLVRSNQVDEEGAKLVTNSESKGRYHSDWLSMIFSRLKLARNLLREDGVIFLSIDDCEVENLKKICDEIFGGDNYLGTIVWKKKTNGNNMGYIPPVHDYIICYGKLASENSLLGFPLTEEFVAKTYSNPDNDPRGPWTTSDLSANHVGPHFEIVNPITQERFLPPKGRYWVFGENDVKQKIQDGRIIFGKSGTGRPIQKKFLSERASMRRKAESWWDSHGMNEDGTSEISNLIAPKAFTHPKPVSTLKHLCNICTQENDIILDFFSGSATTAHSIMQLNAEDGGNRNFIMVQLAEECGERSEAYKAGYKTIAEMGKERIRKAGKNIKEENATTAPNLDIGFRVLKVDTSNMQNVYYTPDTVSQNELDLQIDHIKPDRTDEDLLFQVLLDWGVDLTLPITKETIAGKTVYFVDENALAACFETGINEDFVKELAQRECLRVVFKDNGFSSDAVKINVEQIFKQLSPTTEVKTL